MTRETKIGLLVGLGFIIVFAVLLSNNTPAPPANNNLVVVDGRSSKQVLPIGSRSADSTNPLNQLRHNEQADAGKSRSARNLEPALPAEPSDEVSLPVVDWQGMVRVGEVQLPLLAKSATQPTALADGQRRAPQPFPPEPVEVPRPTIRPEKPDITSTPPIVEPPQPAVPEPAKQYYTVREGDTLWKICKEHYKRATPQTVAFVQQANRELIKNKNQVSPGQKLMMPELPKDMFTPVVSVNVTGAGSRLAKLEEMINTGGSKGGGERRAPSDFKNVAVDDGPGTDKSKPPAEGEKSATKTELKGDPTDAAKENKAVKDNKPDERHYEIQSNDTLMSIADKQLGSSAMWKDIQKLNNIDPNKMRPGMKIKLPRKKPAAPKAASTRGAAA